ncbi:endolytic transglycosylase MltG [Paenibacillus sp. Marseille-P2973]|uniref:endolytic transglycosylase MltG n=1 Tax=Paenibacillus sp. Marseille-P2973 TaxID=1871032 RepID=UPI001B377892|nr:endolytic transglycosylase MltG [Paenibacillus sp. Marseille-P2973]MBQ4897823.1 endolytic transglycosylase MltG [Paenibacillus sp. Marseille-P2973]
MKRALKWLISIILIIVIAGAAGGLYVYNGMQPVKASEQPVKFTIEPRTGTNGIAEILEDQGLIKNSFLFLSYLKWKSEGSRFQAGVYELNPGATYEEIIAKLNSGDVVKAEMIRFTIPEGFTVTQMADKLAEQGIANKEVFLDLAKQATGLSNALLADLSDSDQLTFKLEGYLFPETYELKKGSTETDIVQRMFEETSKRLDEIPDFREKLAQRGMSLNELMTVASLVEREVVADNERSLVAGVIYNRLAEGMKLEIDATVQYLLGKPKERLMNSDLRSVDSPYNTYLYEGLPPGPIAAPSLKSIEAALEPESSEYLFYVTKKDGSGEHLFAKTYNEHLKNIKKSKAAAE